MFSASLALFTILILVSLMLRSDNYGDKLNFRRVFSQIGDQWGELRKGIAIWGIRDVVIIFLITILIFKTTGSEWMVGKLTLYAYLISSVAFIAEQKLIKPKLRMFSLHMGCTHVYCSFRLSD